MKYLLTGGTGTLGQELQKHLNCFAPPRSVLDIGSFDDQSQETFVIQNREQLKSVDTLIHSGAYTDVPGAEINKKDAVEVNIIGTKNILEFANSMEYRVVYISTDYVYLGIGNHKETDKTDPINFYGLTKLAGESLVDIENNLVIRTSFKPNDLWKTKYNKAFVDVFTSADYVDIVAKEIAWLIKTGENGVYNVGTERKSIYDLAKKRHPSVGEMSRWEVNEWIKMPSDISMNMDKFNDLKNNLGENNDL